MHDAAQVRATRRMQMKLAAFVAARGDLVCSASDDAAFIEGADLRIDGGRLAYL